MAPARIERGVKDLVKRVVGVLASASFSGRRNARRIAGQVIQAFHDHISCVYVSSITVLLPVNDLKLQIKFYLAPIVLPNSISPDAFVDSHSAVYKM